MRRRALLASAVLIPLTIAVTAACSGGPEAAPPAEAMKTAEQKLQSAEAVTIDLRADLPKGVNGVSRANGTGIIDEQEPKFKGQVTGVIKGNPAGVDLIAIDDRTWITFFTKEYTQIDIEEELGAPNPAELFRPSSGVATLLPATTNLKTGEQERNGQDILQRYTGTLPAEPIQKLLMLGDDADSFDVTYGIDVGTGELRSVVITGEFYPGESTTFTLNLSGYGKTVDIRTP